MTEKPGGARGDTIMLFFFSFIVKLNEHADLTFDEFSQLRLMDPQHCSATQTQEVGVVKHAINDAPPSSVDWRSKGAVTPVKNQVN